MNKNSGTVRITKTQKFLGIITLLEGKDPIVIPGKDDKGGATLDSNFLIEFCKAEMALLSKKNTSSSGEKKLTKEQEKNEGYKKEIFAYLSANPTLMVSASDIMAFLQKAHPDTVPAWSNQKAASLLNAMSEKFDKDTGELVSDGVLTRIEGKGKTKTLFKLKSVNTEEDTEEVESTEVEDTEEVE